MQYGLNIPYAPPNEPSARGRISGTHLRPTPLSSLPKQIHTNLQNGADSSNETQLRNGRPRGESRGKNYLLPRYWPRFTDQELQQISVEYPQSWIIIKYKIKLFVVVEGL